ncbi:hypothetical protein Q9233_003734 [Columba guinea]|nr:hypothetical protein Q9233_003734 [Columba guinea]
MESRALRWETLAALSSSSKGRLSYGRRWPHDEDLLEGCMSPVVLSPYSGWVLDRVVGQSAPEIAPSRSSTPKEPAPLTNGSSALEVTPASCRGSSPLPPAQPSEAKGNGDLGLLEVDHEVFPAVLPCKVTEVEGCIRMYEEMHRLKGKVKNPNQNTTTTI